MLDALALDQLRTLIGAGRKLRRAQSVVSQSMAILDGQLGVTLFDPSARYSTLSEDRRGAAERTR
jgi:DNA-binding transcriptional LysR family regulator